MRNIVRKVVSLSLALLLCLSPLAVQAQSLLCDGVAKAFEAGRSIEATLGLELDDSVGMIGLLPSESFAAAQELLRTTTIKVFAIRNGEGLPEFGFELRMQDTPIIDGRAWQMGDKLALATNLLPGKTLVMDGTELFQGFEQSVQQFTEQADSLQAIGGSGEKYLAVIEGWVENTEGLLSLSEGEIPGTAQRDAAVRSATLRVTPDQLKELLLALVQELSRDEALMQTLPVTVSPEEIQALVPTDNVMEWTIHFDANDGIAGVDGIVPPMFGDVASNGKFAYDHLNEGGVERHAFGGEIVAEGAGAGVVGFSLEARSDSADPQAPSGSFSLQFQQTNEASATLVQADHTYARTESSDRETLESKTELSLQTTVNAGDPDVAEAATIAAMGDSAFSASLDFASDTRRLGESDFISENALGLNFVGLPLGRVLVTLASGTYAPADSTGNTVVDLEGLDEAGVAALNAEWNAGLEKAGQQAVTMLPPELLSMLQMLN